jgi:predicted dehydrogenase
VRYAGASGGILLDMSVHDIDTVRWLLGAKNAKRVYATGTIAVHEGLRDANDVDNCGGDDRVRRRRDRDDLRVEDDGARPRDADRDRRHRRAPHLSARTRA